MTSTPCRFLQTLGHVGQLTVSLHLFIKKKLLENPISGDNNLQPFTKYSRVTVASMWNSALQEKSNFYFSRTFC